VFMRGIYPAWWIPLSDELPSNTTLMFTFRQ
jgi:hypothetical protein